MNGADLSQTTPSLFCAFLRLSLLALCGVISTAAADDWPQWRYDAHRSAASPQKLADTLHLHWSRQLPARSPLYAGNHLTCIDDTYEPVVADGVLYVGSDSDHALWAIDVATGKLRWKHYVNGAIRFAPLVAGEHVIFGSDDGVLYALDAATGERQWAVDFNNAPQRVMLGGKLASAKACSAGPVAIDGSVYAAFGTWGSEGVTVAEIEAATGTVTKEQTHRNINVWGYPAANAARVIFPSGNHLPNALSREAAKMQRGYGTTRGNPLHATVAATDDLLIAGARAYRTGEPFTEGVTCYANAEHGIRAWLPVVDDSRLFGVNDGILKTFTFADGKLKQHGAWWAVYRPNFEWTRDAGKEMKLPDGVELERLSYPKRVHAKAGDKLIVGAEDAVYLIAAPRDGGDAHVHWVGKVAGEVTSAIAAEGRLFVVTDAHRLYCFGADAVDEPAVFGHAEQGEIDTKAALKSWLGKPGAAKTSATLIDGSRIIAVDSDPQRADAARRLFDDKGILGENLQVVCLDLTEAALPPYVFDVASLQPNPTMDAPALADLLASLLPAVKPGSGIVTSAKVDGTTLLRIKGALKGNDLVGSITNNKSLVIQRAKFAKDYEGPKVDDLIATVMKRGRSFSPPALTPAEQRAKLLATAQDALAANDAAKAREAAEQLIGEHPESEEVAAAGAILARLDLDVAKQHRARGDIEAAQNTLRVLIGRYPKTDAAAEAKKLLDELETDALLEGF